MSSKPSKAWVEDMAVDDSSDLEESWAGEEVMFDGSPSSGKYFTTSKVSHCLKITQNVAFEFLNFDIFHQFLSY